MIVTSRLGNINSSQKINRDIDLLELEWHEVNKKILHKKTISGREIIIKFLNERYPLVKGDILYEDAKTMIVIDVTPCEAIVIKPKNIFETAAVCYEIGNRHLPLFFDNNELLTPYENALFYLLSKSNYEINTEQRVLMNPFKTSVLPHIRFDTGKIFINENAAAET